VDSILIQLFVNVATHSKKDIVKLRRKGGTARSVQSLHSVQTDRLSNYESRFQIRLHIRIWELSRSYSCSL